MSHTGSFFFFLSELRTGGGNLLTGRSSCCETDREIDLSYSCRAPGDTEVRYKHPLPQISRGRLHIPHPICVCVCLCIPSWSVCVISRSLEVLSSALISLTDVTPARQLPQQSHRGGNSVALSVISWSFYQIPLVLFLIVSKNIFFLTQIESPPPFLVLIFGDELHWEITSLWKWNLSGWSDSRCFCQDSPEQSETDIRSVIMQTESHNEIKKDLHTMEITFVIIKSI